MMCSEYPSLRTQKQQNQKARQLASVAIAGVCWKLLTESYKLHMQVDRHLCVCMCRHTAMQATGPGSPTAPIWPSTLSSASKHRLAPMCCHTPAALSMYAFGGSHQHCALSSQLQPVSKIWTPSTRYAVTVYAASCRQCQVSLPQMEGR